MLEGEEFLDNSFLNLSVSVWLKYCINPMRNGEVTCRLVERTLPDGERKKLWALTDEAVVDYIGDFNWKMRLAAIE